MAKADIWMPLYIGDYLADTTRLTTEQHGAYLLLIMDYWRNGSPPDDDSILASVCRTTSQNWKKLRPALVCFFDVINGHWTHTRIEKEIKDAKEGKAKAEAKALKAAEARWGKHATSNAPSITQAMHDECPLQSPSKSIKQKTKKTDATASRLPTDCMPTFSDVQFCSSERPDLVINSIASQFRDYWIAQPGTKGKKLDWAATWRNWVRNQRVQTKINNSEKQPKWDPTAYVNRNREMPNVRTERDITGEIFEMVSSPSGLEGFSDGPPIQPS